MPVRKIAVLTSGGLDSSILIGLLLKTFDEIHPVYIRSGLVWEKAEIFWLKKYLKVLRQKKLMPLTILDMPFKDLDPKGWAVTGKKVPDAVSNDKEVYLPGRNLLLLSKAATYCALHKIPKVALGTLSANPFPDATLKFFHDFSRTASLALGFSFQIMAPFLRLKKNEVLKTGGDLPLHLSFSCLSPRRKKPCHRCNKCAEKERVLKNVV